MARVSYFCIVSEDLDGFGIVSRGTSRDSRTRWASLLTLAPAIREVPSGFLSPESQLPRFTLRDHPPGGARVVALEPRGRYGSLQASSAAHRAPGHAMTQMTSLS